MTQKKYNLPRQCPSCHHQLKVQRLHCEACGTNIEGLFEFPLLMQLNPKDQEFLLGFVKNSGSIKKMSKDLNLSYPTIRNMLNDLIKKIEDLEKKENTND
ncbi:MAG: DUF2089 family protein [Bacteroidales bacterium]